MRETKLTLNAFLLVILLISAIFFFFTVRMVSLAFHPAVNVFAPIEGTELSVCYSSIKPNGIYEGPQNTAVMKLEGDFGYDWGAAKTERWLYLNEYTASELGLTLSRLVRVDLESFEKQELLGDAILRGRCASGELVCLSDSLLPSNYPKTNALCRLYALAAPGLRPESDGARVLFIDPDTGEILYSVRDEEALAEGFEQRYLQRTLEEVRG